MVVVVVVQGRSRIKDRLENGEGGGEEEEKRKKMSE